MYMYTYIYTARLCVCTASFISRSIILFAASVAPVYTVTLLYKCGSSAPRGGGRDEWPVICTREPHFSGERASENGQCYTYL